MVLFEKEKQCSGCAACVDICPQKAVSIKENEDGFWFPQIDENLCIQCGMCKRVCGFQNEKEEYYPLKVKAATTKNADLLIKSSSGGAFAELTQKVLADGGVVFGATMLFKEGVPSVKHIKIDSAKELYKIQGSKYVQSDCRGIYTKVKEELIANKTVLFSGTPCQVASLKQFIGKELQNNLITVDIICHGVPSLRMFRDYIALESTRISGDIVSFKFRDKNIGWGNKGSICYIDNQGKRKIRKISVQLSSYYFYFENGDILRGNCYECPFSQYKRISDISIGDYWGLGKEHPEYLKQNGGSFEEEKGISCILLNTEKGKKLFSECRSNFEYCDSTLKKVAEFNLQLRQPSKMTGNRDKLMELYRKYGYKAIDEAYYKKLGAKKYIYILWNALPMKIRKRLKQLV